MFEIQKCIAVEQNKNCDHFSITYSPFSLAVFGYCPKKVCKLQSSYICVMNKKSTKNNEAYKRTKIGINF